MTDTNVIDQYPSTSDLPIIKGGQDAVLAILKGARKRYARHMTIGSYIGHNGAVCAVGAVAREAGVTYAMLRTAESEISFGWDTNGIGKLLKVAEIEKETIAATKTAIRLLNRSARKLFPESKNYKGDETSSSWSGPLEWINQAYQPEILGQHPDTNEAVLRIKWREKRDKARRKAVLACYDDAIAKREEA